VTLSLSAPTQPLVDDKKLIEESWYRYLSQANIALNQIGKVLLTSGTATSTATLDILLTPYTDYPTVEIVFDYLVPATDSTVLYMRTSTDGGTAYDSGAAAYQFGSTIVSSNAATATLQGTSTEMQLINTVSADGTLGLSGEVLILNRTSTTMKTKANWRLSSGKAGGAMLSSFGGGLRDSSGDVNAVRFLMSSGNISSASYRVYGNR
jgi:hypothetical protein